MRPLPPNTIAFDCETHLIRPGLLDPPLVCLTIATEDMSAILHRSDEDLVPTIEMIFDAPLVVGARTAFDVAVVMKFAPHLIPHILRAYEEDRVVDVQINQKLIDIAEGKWDLPYFAKLKRSYSLAALVMKHFGRDRSAEKTDPNAWRLRYSELHDVPIERWPRPAVTYAMDDADDALAVAKVQGTVTDMFAQARADLALHLLSVRGIMTDEQSINELENATADRFRDLTAELMREGFIRANGVRDTKKVKARMVAVCRAAGITVPLTDTGLETLRKTVKDATAKGDDGEPLARFAQGAAALRETCVDLCGREALEKIEAAYASTDAESCELSGDPVLVRYAERTSLQTIVDTHIPDLRKGTVTPLQASWDIAASGRVTCSKGRGGSTNGFQLTNPARAIKLSSRACDARKCAVFGGKGEIEGPGVRECFIARPGFVFADPDFVGLELSTVAQVCKTLIGRSRLGDQINAGIDPHLAFGAALMGISYAEAYERRHEKIVKAFRQLAKVANFGFPGGLGIMGFLGFARGYGLRDLTTDRVRELKTAWLTEYDEFREYFAMIGALCESSEDGFTDIEQLGSGRIRGSVRYTAACNTMFQGLGADAAKAALWAVTRATFDPSSLLYGCGVVNFVHDEIPTEILENNAHARAMEMKRLMETAANRFLPDVPVKVSIPLSKRWFKNAEEVYLDGELVPWDWAREERWPVVYADGREVVW